MAEDSYTTKADGRREGRDSNDETVLPLPVGRDAGVRGLEGHPIPAAADPLLGPHPPAAPRPHEDAARRHRELAAEARRQAQQAAAEARRAMEEAGREIRQAYHEAKAEIGQAYREARDEIRQAYREVVADNDGRPPLPPPPPPPRAVPALEEADGLPVPIVPGTRVTEAEAKPPVPARPAGPGAARRRFAARYPPGRRRQGHRLGDPGPGPVDRRGAGLRDRGAGQG